MNSFKHQGDDSTVVVESFVDFADASMFMERTLGEMTDEDKLVQANITYMNNKWRVGIVFVDAQMNLLTGIEEQRKWLQRSK